METTKTVEGEKLQDRKMKCHPPPNTQLVLCLPSGPCGLRYLHKRAWLGFHAGTKQRAGRRGQGRLFLRDEQSRCHVTVISVCTPLGLRGLLSCTVSVTACAPSGSLARRPFQRRLSVSLFTKPEVASVLL